jgi:CheY-like chemotaxis protein/anti-sigma regulatory factor (Ser/Thr protein kinase)
MSRSLSVELSPPVLHDAGLGGALEWLARWMRDKHNFTVELSVDIQPRLPEDVTILVFESVRELLFNAVKHAKTSWARVGLHQNGRSEIRILVSDEGVGFDPSRLDSTETATGGLGLFSIRERIDSIGGRVEIDSAPGKGCQLTMVVPAAVEPVPLLPERSPSTPDRPHEHSRKEKCIRVLLADDHALFRDGIGRILNQEPDIEVIGYAKDGREAIELARKLAPYVILMDISMPEVNGIEATRVICRESSAIQIIGLSMYEDEERSQAMLAAGAVGYKSKGCAAAELVSAIRSCVE